MNKEFFNLVQQFQGILPLIINDINSCVNVSEQYQPELFPEENALKVFCEKYNIPFKQPIKLVFNENATPPLEITTMIKNAVLVINEKGFNMLNGEQRPLSPLSPQLTETLLLLVIYNFISFKEAEELEAIIPKVNEEYCYLEDNGEKKFRINCNSQFDKFLIQNKNCFKKNL